MVSTEIFLKPLALALAGLLAGPPISAAPATASDYTLLKSIPLGAPDRWDYVVYDGQTERVYIAHGDRLAVLELEKW